MSQRAWKCSCGVGECLVGHEGALMQDREIEILLRHHGLGHDLREVPVEAVAPGPTS